MPTADPAIAANHRFNAEESDWGFTRFCDLRKLFYSSFDGTDSPFVENDEACMTAYVRVVKDPTGVLWHNFQKCVHAHFARSYRIGMLTDNAVTIRKRRRAWLA